MTLRSVGQPLRILTQSLLLLLGFIPQLCGVDLHSQLSSCVESLLAKHKLK